MRIAVNRMHYPVTVLGYGKRLGIWLQGCSIGCEGCLARDTWAHDATQRLSIDTLIASAREMISGELDGITISGGEPFEQPEALLAALDALRDHLTVGSARIDFLCYSGMPLRVLRARHRGILERLDAIVPEPFNSKRAGAYALRGSANQSVVALSALGRERYADGASRETTSGPHLQLAVEHDRLWVIGVPRPGDLEGVRSALSSAEIVHGRISWHS